MDCCRWAAVRRESQDIEELLAHMRRAIAEVEVCPPPPQTRLSPSNRSHGGDVLHHGRNPWRFHMWGGELHFLGNTRKTKLMHDPTILHSYNHTIVHGVQIASTKYLRGGLFIFSPKTSAMAPDRFGWKHTCVAHRTDSGPGMFLVVCSQPFPTADYAHTHVCLHVCVCGTTRRRSSDIRIPIPSFSGPQSLGRNSVSSVAGDGRRYTGWDRAVAARKP